MTSGGKRIVILGILSIVAAMTTTGVSLAIYHVSGDIYIDRSRPGYLPDKDEINDNEPDDEYVFNKTGEITEEVIDEYIEKLNEEIKAVDDYGEAFSDSALSDEKLGITDTKPVAEMVEEKSPDESGE